MTLLWSAVCHSMEFFVSTAPRDRLTAVSPSLMSDASDAVVTVTVLSVQDARRLLQGCCCDADNKSDLGGGTGVTEGLAALESLLTSRTLIGSVELTRLI